VAERQWAVRAADGTVVRTSETVAQAATTEGGYTLGADDTPIVATLYRDDPDGSWYEWTAGGGGPKVILQAVALMREVAEAATPGPWTTDNREMWVLAAGENILDGCCPGDGAVNPGDGAHIASWHPGVALAVADWLEQAGALEAHVEDRGALCCPACKVAHTYLGQKTDG
jgi:hypothetical protein